MAIKNIRIGGQNFELQDTTYGNATTSTAGLMSVSDKIKLNSIASGANAYSHPTYTSKSSGLYKITVDGTGHVSGATAVTKADITNLGIPGSDTNTTYSASTGLGLSGTAFWLTTADTVEIGGICVTNVVSSRNNINSTNGNTSGRNYGVQINADDEAFVNVPWTDHTYYGNDGINVDNEDGRIDLLTASADTLGGIKLGYGENSNKYAVQLDTNGKAFVQVPWTDHEYGLATTLSAGLMTSAMVSKLNGIASGANNYSLPTASANTLGGIKIGYSQNNKNYPVELDSNGKAYVNVPWVTNTTYSLGGLMGSSTIGGTTQPIYWNGSAFVNTSYTLGKSVPSNAKFTDTIYTLPLADVLAKGGFRAGYPDNYHGDYVRYGVSVVNESNLSSYECAYVGISTASHNYAGLMSTADKVKLDGIASGANNYTHPTYTSKSSGLYKITVDSKGHVSGATAVTKADITGLGIPGQDTNTTYGNATTSAAGLMSASDKTKLDNLASKVSSLESQISSLNNRINEILSGGYY